MSDVHEAIPNPSGSEISSEASESIDPASLAAHYEQDDVDVRSIMRFAITIAVGVGLAMTILWIGIRYWAGEPLPFQAQMAPAAVTPSVVKGPGLDAAPEENLDMMLQHQNEWLHTYGWLDHNAGVVHIPIDRAMQLLVKQNVPARAGDVPDFRLAPSFRMDSSGGITSSGGQ